MDDHEIYQRAKRRVGQLRGFYVHATVYAGERVTDND